MNLQVQTSVRIRARPSHHEPMANVQAIDASEECDCVSGQLLIHVWCAVVKTMARTLLDVSRDCVAVILFYTRIPGILSSAKFQESQATRNMG